VVVLVLVLVQEELFWLQNGSEEKRMGKVGMERRRE